VREGGLPGRLLQDFKHPLLLQATRLVNARVQAEDLQAVTRLGGSVSAMAAAGLVPLMYLLARPRLRVAAGCAMTAGPALLASVVIYAHFKEDLLLTLFCCLSLLAWTGFLAEPTRRTALLLGLATGLAFSSHCRSLPLGVLYLLTLAAVAASLWAAANVDKPDRLERVLLLLIAAAYCVVEILPTKRQ
jgi:4-amino-4-deoxy-L-arabinose transferase-like glycosyltransferase